MKLFIVTFIIFFSCITANASHISGKGIDSKIIKYCKAKHGNSSMASLCFNNQWESLVKIESYLKRWEKSEDLETVKSIASSSIGDDKNYSLGKLRMEMRLEKWLPANGYPNEVPLMRLHLQ